jgi:transposase
MLTGPDGTVTKETRTCGTTTAALLQLLDWLLAVGCTQVAMESTGEYWKPVYNILEGHVAVWLVNAQHVKTVPGRKTDVKDAEWLADLLWHGLLRRSFIPPRPQRELRDLTRQRSNLVRERADVVNRLQKVLEDAKGTYLAALYPRLAGRRGKKRAIVAVAHAIVVAIYFMLLRGVPYQELGSNYFDERQRQSTVNRLMRRLKKLGYQVKLEPIAAAAQA